MSPIDNTAEYLKQYHVWDRTVRIFHWDNVICVIGLLSVGIVILNNKILGISTDGKILLKTIHVFIGYVFFINLGYRLVWAFIGNRFSKWKSIIPFTKEHRASFKAFMDGERNNSPAFFLGHNPLGRLMVAFLFLLLSTQAITGLVLAGTDIYFPPFGNTITEWIAEDKNNLADIKPYSKVNVNPDSYKEMRDFRKPFITTHVYVFYTLLGAILLHIIGVVVSELREKTGLVSAMFTGIKASSKKPVDTDEV
jgi:Ni/Fe-hydrogenase 1 B-type cytochrome subunit